MEKVLKLAAITRSKDEKMSVLKKEGLVPGVLYGPSSGNISLKLKKSEVEKAFKSAGESNLIDLTIDGKDSFKALFKNVDREVMKGHMIHVDLYQVDMTKKVIAEIPLRFIGESKAIKDFGGTLVKAINHIEVECLPIDLTDHIDIDLSGLNSLGDSIFVGDLKLPASVKIIGLHADNMIASAVETVVEAIVAPVAAPAAKAAEKKPAEKKK